jgi:hypothetical protein
MSALSLQGVLGYTNCKALNTPQTAEYITPVSSDFFTSIDYLWSGNEQAYNTRMGKPAGRLFAVFNVPGCPLNKGSTEQTNRRPIYGC